jgi:hypothetical protein
MMAARTGRLACAAALCIPLPAPAEGQADAGPLTVALDYTAASDCPDASSFKAIVTGRLGYDAFREGVPERVLVQIASRPPAFEGRIEWRDAEGRWAGDRTFPSRSDDCRELTRAMAFALALQIQLSASVSVPPAASAATPAEAIRSAEAPAPPPVPPAITPPPSEQRDVPALAQAAESPTRGHRPVLAVGAGALVGFGVSSSAVPFGRVFGSVAWPHWSLELAAEVGLPTTERRADGAGFSQQELLVGAASCGTLAPWSACLLGKGGVIRIVGKDIDYPTSHLGPLVETGLRLAVMQPLGRRVYVTARAEGLLIVTRWRVTLDQTPVWTSSRFAETIGLDVGVRLW